MLGQPVNRLLSDVGRAVPLRGDARPQFASYGTLLLIRSDCSEDRTAHSLRITVVNPEKLSWLWHHRALTAERRHATDRLVDLTELRDLAAAYDRPALATETPDVRSGGVKPLTDGRPQDGYVRAFIDAAGKVA